MQLYMIFTYKGYKLINCTFMITGLLKLVNNAQVPVGSNVTIDISSLPRDTPVNCQLETILSEEKIPICVGKPLEHSCDPRNQYQGRSSYFNATTFQITGVFKNESGIYICNIIGPGSTPPVVISGVIIVGKFIRF